MGDNTLTYKYHRKNKINKDNVKVEINLNAGQIIDTVKDVIIKVLDNDGQQRDIKKISRASE